MTFTSLTFLFLFLPVVLLVYFFLAKKKPALEKLCLILVSLIFYAWGDAKALPVLLLSVLFNYAAGQVIREWKHTGRVREVRIAAGTAVVLDVVVLALFKYTTLRMPLGLSFYTFSALSYLFDVLKEEEETGSSWVDEVLYITFFPKIVSGPIVSYQGFLTALRNQTHTRNDILIGTHLFVIGMFKKVLLADTLGAAFQSIYALPKMAALTAWLGMLFYGLQLYFDFSGYSDMAIGLARILGFRFEKNFDHPYTAKSIAEFWRRWHISLGAWFRNYVYIPLGGNRCSTLVQVRNLMAVWLLTGIWHGSTLNYVFWGIYHGCFVLLERFVIGKRRDKIPAVLQVIVTDLIVFFGWIAFFTPTFGDLLSWIGRMFGADQMGFANGTSIYYLYNYLLLIVIACLASGPLLKSLHQKLVYKQGGWRFYVSAAIHVILILLCFANMVGATYQSFLYFQF